MQPDWHPATIASTFVALLLLTTPAVSSDAVVINGRPLTTEERQYVARLERQYNTRVQPGRYWYDPKSGLWGNEGGPTMGAILPHLRIGGPLSPRASSGNTGVFVNGRELHQKEIQALNRCTPVQRGRFWLDAQGNGGHEGAPVTFNLLRLCQNSSVRLNGTPGNRGWYGSTSGDGSMVGSVFSDGVGVTCGPDGGCIFSSSK